jgi:hypothetical protein
MPTSLDNSKRSPRKHLASVVKGILNSLKREDP